MEQPDLRWGCQWPTGRDSCPPSSRRAGHRTNRAAESVVYRRVDARMRLALGPRSPKQEVPLAAASASWPPDLATTVAYETIINTFFSAVNATRGGDTGFRGRPAVSLHVLGRFQHNRFLGNSERSGDRQKGFGRSLSQELPPAVLFCASFRQQCWLRRRGRSRASWHRFPAELDLS